MHACSYDGGGEVAGDTPGEAVTPPPLSPLVSVQLRPRRLLRLARPHWKSDPPRPVPSAPCGLTATTQIQMGATGRPHRNPRLEVRGQGVEGQAWIWLLRAREALWPPDRAAATRERGGLLGSALLRENP